MFPVDMDNVYLRVLPSGQVLHDASIFVDFIQDELGIDPKKFWETLLTYPKFPDDQQIPFREKGGDVHWVMGSHHVLKYRRTYNQTV